MTITLRERERKNGNKALYLDIYHNGKRINEYLNLFLVPEINKEAVAVNKNAIKRAMEIRSERILHPETISFSKTKKQREKNNIEPSLVSVRKLDEWLDRYEILMQQEDVSRSIKTQVAHINAIIRSYLKHIYREQMLLNKVDREFVAGFLAWLRTDYKSAVYTKHPQPLSQASLHQYQMRFNCVLNRAVREGLLKKNPFYALGKYEVYQQSAPNRVYLTKEEVERFLAVETDGKEVQRAFGFACFTGLRKGDIKKLKWGDICTQGDSMYIIVKQQKTGEQLIIPLGKKAQQHLPIKPNGAKLTDSVFHLPTNNAIRRSVDWIARKAGITKDICFHTSRHTFATLTLLACKDIQMVSQLLGHKSVVTTQIYAEVQMVSKVEAVNTLNGNFGNMKARNG